MTTSDTQQGGRRAKYIVLTHTIPLLLEHHSTSLGTVRKDPAYLPCALHHILASHQSYSTVDYTEFFLLPLLFQMIDDGCSRPRLLNPASSFS